jgi:hypothetical protein
MKREKEIKNWKSRKMIEKLIGLGHPDYNREGRRFDPVNSHKSLAICGAFIFVLSVIKYPKIVLTLS